MSSAVLDPDETGMSRSIAESLVVAGNSPPLTVVLGSNRSITLWGNSRRGIVTVRPAPVPDAHSQSLGPTPPSPTAGPWQLCAELLAADADPPRDRSVGGGVCCERTPPLFLCWRGNGGAPLPPRNSCLHPGMGSPLFGRKGDPGPSFSQSACLSTAALFLKATSVHIGKLQIVYMGNVSCPHMKIYTSLRPKCLRLEIERQSPGLTFCSLMEPLLMSAELLGGMFSYVEAKHMVAISLGVGVGVHYTNSICPNRQSPPHLILQPHGLQEGLAPQGQRHIPSPYLRRMVCPWRAR